MAWVQKLEEKYQVRFFGHAAGQPKRPIVYFEQLNRQVLCVKVALEGMVIRDLIGNGLLRKFFGQSFNHIRLVKYQNENIYV